MISESQGPPIKVLYILGMGRSGTTLLDLLLGQIEDFFSVGELQSLWKESLGDGRLCGCGTAVSECPLWMSILNAPGIPAPPDVIRLQEQLRIHRTLMSRRTLNSHAASRYRLILSDLYRAIAHETASRVLVDSSKLPSIARLLDRTPGITPFLVQVTRDPRAVAFSWLRKKYAADRLRAQQMEQFSAQATSRLWLARHFGAELIRWGSPTQSLLIRYEDLVENPRRVIAAIVDRLGERADLAFIRDRHAVDMTPNHTVSGNPVRLGSGRIQIAEDRDWQAGLPRSSRAVVTALTWPLMLRYRYALRSGTFSGGRVRQGAAR